MLCKVYTSLIQSQVNTACMPHAHTHVHIHKYVLNMGRSLNNLVLMWNLSSEGDKISIAMMIIVNAPSMC